MSSGPAAGGARIELTRKMLASALRGVVHRLHGSAALRLRALRLIIRNRFSTASVTGDALVVVSVTSMPSRLKHVGLALESIAAGSVRPMSMTLWLDDDSLRGPLPYRLRRLQKRGLSVRRSEDWGPHKKYYPHIVAAECPRVPLVTADDDVMYPSWWLQVLMTAYEKDRRFVYGTRAKRLSVKSGVVAPYATWKVVDAGGPSFKTMLTGVGGILYPPQLQAALRRSGKAFLDSCPRTDDLWIHAHAVQVGMPMRLATSRSHEYLGIPGSQASALTHLNVQGPGNDTAAARVYSAELVRLIEDDWAVGSSSERSES